MKLSTITALAIAAAAACPNLARADNYIVTTLLDSGLGSLRSAIDEANGHAGPDTVTFHASLSGVLALQTTIFVYDSLMIIGPPSRGVVIDAGTPGIAFRVQNNSATTDFGAIDLEAANGGSFMFTDRQKLRLSFQRCVFRDIGATSPLQAGVFNNNWLDRTLVGTVQSCSFINNHGVHAGICITNPDPAGEPLNFVNCTFAGNGSSNGGGVVWIWNGSIPGQGMTTFTNCTITGNSGGESNMAMGAVHISGGQTGTVLAACRVKNSIVAENSAGAPVADANFTSLHAEAVTFQGNNIFASPGLATLQQVNGCYIRSPLPGSPCIDAAAADPSVRTDQLGTSRPRVAPGATLPAGSDGADIGAVEAVPAPCSADFNRSGAVTVQDIFDFLTAYFSGC